jgi:hypothetical protein
MSGATFPGGQGAVGWGRSRQDLAPPVLLGPLTQISLPWRRHPGRMADAASDVTIGMLGPLEVRVGVGEPVEVVGPAAAHAGDRLASGLHRRRVCRFRWKISVIASHGLPVSMHEL